MKVTRDFLAKNMVKNAINLYDKKILDSNALYYELNKVGDFLVKKNNTDKYLAIKEKEKWYTEIISFILGGRMS